MKSQDVLLLLKLVALEQGEPMASSAYFRQSGYVPDDWKGWAGDSDEEPVQPLIEAVQAADDRYSVRGLEETSGISKSAVSASIRRCVGVGLVRNDRSTGRPRANKKALFDFICAGVKYVFPAKLGPIARGIPTAAFAPVLAGKLMSPIDSMMVWEDGYGLEKGQSVEPIHKAVPHAVRRDPILYALLALTDSIRIGHGREVALAQDLLRQYMGER